MKIFLAILGMVFISSPAFACAVCFGDPNSPMVKAVGWGIWTLMGFIGGVLILFAVFFLNIRRRIKKLRVS